MTAAVYTVVTLAALGCMAKVVHAVMKDRGQPPHDRVALTWRQRVTWFRFTRRFRRDLLRQLAIALTEEEIDRLGRRLREHLGLEGGET